MISTLFIIALPFYSAFFSAVQQKTIWNFIDDKHQRRFHQTLLHFIYENYIFLIGLFPPLFISFTLRDVSNRLFYGIQQKTDFKIFIFYCYSNFIFRFLVARRTLIANNNNNESKCKWILI